MLPTFHCCQVHSVFLSPFEGPSHHSLLLGNIFVFFRALTLMSLDMVFFMSAQPLEFIT